MGELERSSLPVWRPTRRQLLKGIASIPVATAMAVACTDEWRDYKSPNFPYKMKYPPSWSVISADAELGKLDMFIENKKHPLRCSVAVDGKVRPPGSKLPELYAEYSTQGLLDLAGLFGVSTAMKLVSSPGYSDPDGLERAAYGGSYHVSLRFAGEVLDSVIFLSENYVWYLALMTERSIQATKKPVFRQMLQSFTPLDDRSTV